MPRAASLILAGLIASGPAWAQTNQSWPERPVRFIVPFQPGSSSDTVARVVAQKLGERLGQQFVIDNRVGASGNLGTEAIAHAEPDGYTIGLANSSTHAVAVSLSSKLGYDPVNDFAAVTMIGASPFILSVYPGLPANTIAELIALARNKPRGLSYASAGPASSSHLAGALFEKLAKVELMHVPYRGSAQSVLDLVEGRIAIQFGTIPPTLSLVRDGKVRALAVTGSSRSPTIPEVPTIAESGVPGYEASLWQAIVMPARTPAAVVARLNREMRVVLDAADVKAALTRQGIELAPGTPDELAGRIAADIVKWRDVVHSTGIRAE
ncbi:MAG: Bug family tripartite tricarboxylate transporter substrate binding protein [Xanthobacteraceae bacterium]